jgi:hypothetical protein
MRFALPLILLLACSLLQAQTPPNLLPNPGFETLNAVGFAAGWQGGEFGKPGANVTLDQTISHTGSCSLRLSTAPNSFVTSRPALIPAKPSTRYFITWWCKTRDLKQARAYLWLQTNQAQRVLADANQYVTTDWTQHFAQYVTTADETGLAPVPTTHDTGGGVGYAWFDDIGIYEGGFPPDLAATYRAYQREQSGVSETALTLSKSADLTVWADSLAARIYREDGLPDYAKPAAAVPVSAARGEENYFQVSVIPAADLADVVVVPAPLTGPATLPATVVRWWPVGYANVKTAHVPTTRLGLTPDPLLDPAPTAAPKGVNTTFLISLQVPRDAKAGQYRTTLLLQAGGKTIGRIPVALRVYDFTLPADPVFRTIITFAPSEVARFDKRPLLDVEHDICRVLADHGIRGHGATVSADAKIVDGKVVCDFTQLDARIEWVMQNLNFNAFFLGPCFGGGTSEGWQKHHKWLGMEPLSDEFNKYFPDYMRQVAQHLREKGWLDRAYLYLWDEPEHDYFDKVVALQKLALQGDPALKIWETTSPANQAFWGVVKAWSVPFSRPSFDEPTVDARRAAGDEIWVYNIPATLECPPQEHRLWFWMAAKYGAIGAQLWEVTFYHGINPWEEITPKPYPVGRNGTSLYYYTAGQAILLYPNPKGGLPCPSLRLKLLQKGLDDFAYLTLYQAALARRAGTQSPQAGMRQLAGTLVTDIDHYNLDTNLLEKTRQQMAEAIMAAGVK